MTTQADFDRLVESQRGVRRLLRRDLLAWWVTVEHLAPSEIRAEAAAYLPLLAATYGEVSATAAADFYDASRADSRARGRYVAALPTLQARTPVRRNVRWAVDPLFTGDRDAALGRMLAVTDEAALQEGRNTIMHNAQRDPAKPRFARIPVGETCAWCLMLASRGAVYRSAASAGAAGQYHGGDCDCEPVPSWNHGKDLPPSYDEGYYFEVYDRARSDAGSGDPREIARAMRRLDGGRHVRDGVKPPT